MNPLISLVTVVKNGAETIARTLASVAAQTYPNVEYIVLDGDSTDGTQQIIEQYRQHLQVYHSRPDKGPSYAGQEAFALAKGDIIGVVAADDWLEPDALATIAALYAKNPDADLFCFGLEEHRENAASRFFIDPAHETFGLKDGLYCHGLNRFYHRRTFERIGNFDAERWKHLADRDFYIRLGLAGVKRARTERVLYHFQAHAGSQTASGNREKTVRLLEETVAMADHYLAPRNLTTHQRLDLEHWHSFNALRLAYFQLRLGRIPEATKRLFVEGVYFPMSMISILLDYRMPKEYKSVSAL